MKTHPRSRIQRAKKADLGRRRAGLKRQQPSVVHGHADLALLQRAVSDPARARPEAILGLQSAVGNRAVSRLVQAKLIVNGAGDTYEREADRVAERVLSQPVPAGGLRSLPGAQPVAQRQVEEEEVQAKPLAASITRLVQRQAEEEEEVQTKPLQRQSEEEEVQTKPTLQRRADGSFEAGRGLERRLAARKGSGSPLPDGVLGTMEARFGADFGDVRVHDDSEAVQMNQDLQAHAFTHGRDIYLGEGSQALGSGAGTRLLAHELTHVIQQSGKNDRIARWGKGPPWADPGTSHTAITEAGFGKLVSEAPQVAVLYSQQAQSYLAKHSDSMDSRGWYLASVGGHQLSQAITKWRAKGMYMKALTDVQMAQKGWPPSRRDEYKMQVKNQYKAMVGYARNASEAPNHAEAGLYKADEHAVNEKRRDAYVENAIAAWQAGDKNQAMYILALGLHTAQDRGAHGDGKPGTGHDPRQLIPVPYGADADMQEYARFYRGQGWKGEHCDSIDHNPRGYEIAKNETVYVLTKFAAGLGLSTGEEQTGKEQAENVLKARKLGLEGWKQPGRFKRALRGMARFFGGKDVIRP